MTRILFAAVLAVTLGASSCTRPVPPPNLTPQATRAFYGTQILQDLDRLREVAVAAHATTPPLLSAEDTLAIVKWHEASRLSLKAGQAGWQTGVSTALDQVLLKLNPTARSTLAPYVAIVKALLKEIR